MNIAFRVHKLIGCKGVTRSDFKFYNNKFYLLEVNTQPVNQPSLNFHEKMGFDRIGAKDFDDHSVAYFIK